MNEIAANISPRFPLPEGWSSVEVVRDEIAVGDVLVERAGVAATSPSGEEMTGSAASVSGARSGEVGVVDRSWFELLERVATLDAIARDQAWPVRTSTRELVRLEPSRSIFPSSDEPLVWVHARSNGIALHSSWEEACRRARLELVERHRALGAWYGETGREVAQSSRTNAVVDRLDGYDWYTRRLLPSRCCFSDGIEVALVVGLSTTPTRPMAIGFGAAEDLESAVERATDESVQLLSFLWQEPVLDSVSSTKPGATIHLEHFQTPHGQEALRRWLHRDVEPSPSPSRPLAGGDIGYIELSSSLPDGLHVVKAMHPDARPLAFGDSPFVRHLPASSRLHPIP